ncbi:MAG: response regulator transcription factor [Anaerolineae bacterium]|nr:response regulator transcription factor [Anaerolineae bacterium]
MFLKTEPAIEIIGEAEDGHDAVRQAKCLQPDVILMDLVMANGGGIEAITELKEALPHIKIIVLTTFSDEGNFNAAIKAGADGYLLKDADGEALLDAIEAAKRGDMPLHPGVTRHLMRGVTNAHKDSHSGQLTGREQEVLSLVAKGMSNHAIALTLHLSKGTVKVHVSNILSKLQATSRTEAAMVAIQLGLISPSEGG